MSMRCTACFVCLCLVFLFTFLENKTFTPIYRVPPINVLFIFEAEIEIELNNIFYARTT